jgi:molecular chaperone IbpA
MRTLDVPAFWRSTVGFDRLFDLINETSRRTADEGDYPAYDIARTGDDTYRVSLAVAGFAEDDVRITAEQNLLTVAGEKTDVQQGDFLHKGISARSFERRFNLEDHVEVEGAWLESGLLHIDLVRRVPEAMKPRRIAIKATQPGGVGVRRDKAGQPTRASA